MNHLVIFLPAIDPGVDSEGNLMFAGVLLSLALINVWTSLPIDIFSSWAMYKLAWRRGFFCPWLAWIPFANLWILGSLADLYVLEKRGHWGWNRYALLMLLILLAVTELASRGNSQLAVSVWEWMQTYELVLIPLYVVGIVAVYRSLNRVYCSCKTAISDLFTVLSLLVPFSTPVLLLIACRWEKE